MYSKMATSTGHGAAAVWPQQELAGIRHGPNMDTTRKKNTDTTRTQHGEQRTVQPGASAWPL